MQKIQKTEGTAAWGRFISKVRDLTLVEKGKEREPGKLNKKIGREENQRITCKRGTLTPQPKENRIQKITDQPKVREREHKERAEKKNASTKDRKASVGPENPLRKGKKSKGKGSKEKVEIMEKRTEIRKLGARENRADEERTSK